MVWCYIAGGNLRRVYGLASSSECVRRCEGRVRGIIVAYSHVAMFFILRSGGCLLLCGLSVGLKCLSWS